LEPAVATNENTNGLLRQYYQKGANFSAVTQAQLDAVAKKLNTRPQETQSLSALGFRDSTFRTASFGLPAPLARRGVVAPSLGTDQLLFGALTPRQCIWRGSNAFALAAGKVVLFVVPERQAVASHTDGLNKRVRALPWRLRFLDRPDPQLPHRKVGAVKLRRRVG